MSNYVFMTNKPGKKFTSVALNANEVM